MFRCISTNKLSASARMCLAMAVTCAGGLTSAVQAQEVPRVQAQPAQPAQPPTTVLLPALKVGEATRKLLEIQAQGVAASPLQYAMPVAVAQKVYQRYVDSFAHPIPEKLGSTLEQRP